MAVSIKKIMVENFKSYSKLQWIKLSDLSVLLGANSSGKSTALQTLLLLKQTIECNNPEIDLLLSGKYVTLGDFQDIVNDREKNQVSIGVALSSENESEADAVDNHIIWRFGAESNLKEVEFRVSGHILGMVQGAEHRYAIFMDGDRTYLQIELHNLQFGNVLVEYGQQFNEVFRRFLNDLLCALTQTKKQIRISKDDMVALDGVETFFDRLLESGLGVDKKIEDSSNAVSIADDIIELINKYASYQLPSYFRFGTYPELLKRNILRTFIGNRFKDSVEYGKIQSLLSKYQEEFEAFSRRSVSDNRKGYSYLNRFYMGHQRGVFGREDSEINLLDEIRVIYDQFLEILKNTFYIGPIRQEPQGMYNIGFESVPKYVGKTGAFFASVLLQEESRERSYIMPEGRKERTTLWEALDAWTMHLNVASGVHVERKNSFGFSVIIENTQNKESDIMNVGIGTSQVLPVLITGLLSEERETLIFEQPELHLHPYSQSRLADFFVILAKYGRRVIIETHSEYMLLRLRYLILSERVGHDQIAVNFFQNDNGTKVDEGILNSYGSLEYPADFKDSTQDLVNDLMNAAMMKGKRDETQRVNRS